MKIRISPVADGEDEAGMVEVRRQVFEREMGIRLAPLPSDRLPSTLHLLARVKGNPVAALSVVDTTGDAELLERLGLEFDPRLPSARYTRLAVLREYRGLGLPVRMILEAHKRIIGPGAYEYSWLLFDAERARSSSLCRSLAFLPGDRARMTEYGLSIALVRNERAVRCKEALEEAEREIERESRAFRQTVMAAPGNGFQ
jgi:GNAT superfamily N-acetyltransferase